jgi:HdeA/HdeB family
MRRLMGCLAIMGVILPSIAHGQVGIDMTSVTCAQYLAMPPGQARVFSAWMSGWANQKAGRNVIYLDAFNKNIESIRGWCNASPNESVMTLLQRVVPKS